MGLLFCLPLLPTQALAALTNRFQRAARSKDKFANTATGRFRIFVVAFPPSFADDFQLSRVHGPCFGGGFLMSTIPVLPVLFRDCEQHHSCW